jgi:hypothetical protein
VPKKAPAKPKGVTGLRSEASTRQARDEWQVTGKTEPLYRRPPPKPRSAEHRSAQNESAHTRSNAPRSTDLPHARLIAPSHFTLREDGSIQSSAGVPPAQAVDPDKGRRDARPALIFQSDNPFIRLYHGNCLELLDAIAAKYPDGRFDAIFADPPYFLSNGGITCHAGKMVKVDKGDWDVSRGPELNHEFIPAKLILIISFIMNIFKHA